MGCGLTTDPMTKSKVSPVMRLLKKDSIRLNRSIFLVYSSVIVLIFSEEERMLRNYACFIHLPRKIRFRSFAPLICLRKASFLSCVLTALLKSLFSLNI